jgi:hypothetical protein
VQNLFYFVSWRGIRILLLAGGVHDILSVCNRRIRILPLYVAVLFNGTLSVYLDL